MQAYTGTQVAAALQNANSQTTTHDPNTNVIAQSITAGQECLNDEARKFFATRFPTGATANDPLSLNTVLGDGNAAGGTLVWSFVKLSPYDVVC